MVGYVYISTSNTFISKKQGQPYVTFKSAGSVLPNTEVILKYCISILSLLLSGNESGLMHTPA